MADPLISKYLKKLVSEEIIPTLSPVPGVSFDDYFSIIESRFANPEIRDTVPRLCQDASNRLPKFILPIIAANIKNNKDCKGLALVVALWCRLCFEGGNIASNFTLDDPQSARLITQAKLAKEDASIFLQMNDIFGDLSDDVNFSKNFSLWLEMLWDVGTLATLKHYLK